MNFIIAFVFSFILQAYPLPVTFTQYVMDNNETKFGVLEILLGGTDEISLTYTTPSNDIISTTLIPNPEDYRLTSVRYGFPGRTDLSQLSLYVNDIQVDNIVYRVQFEHSYQYIRYAAVEQVGPYYNINGYLNLHTSVQNQAFVKRNGQVLYKFTGPTVLTQTLEISGPVSDYTLEVDGAGPRNSPAVDGWQRGNIILPKVYNNFLPLVYKQE